MKSFRSWLLGPINHLIGQVDAELSLAWIDSNQTGVAQRCHVDRFVRVHTSEINHALQLKQRQWNVLAFET